MVKALGLCAPRGFSACVKAAEYFLRYDVPVGGKFLAVKIANYRPWIIDFLLAVRGISHKHIVVGE